MAPKDAYYFSHDANARREDKCIALRGVYGWAGYGRFWAIVEILRESQDYRIDITTPFAMAKIADELGLSLDEAKEFVNVLVDDFHLLYTDGQFLWSESLNRRMEVLDKKRKVRAERAQSAARGRWKEHNEVKDNSDDAQASDSDACASDSDAYAHENDACASEFDAKESKEKEIKESKEENIEETAHADAPRGCAPETIDDVVLYFAKLGVEDVQTNAGRFWNHYEGNGWMKGNTPIKKWKAAARSWIDRLNEFSTKTSITTNTTSGAKPSGTKPSITQQRVEFDPTEIERDTAQALAELEAANDRNRNRGSP